MLFSKKRRTRVLFSLLLIFSFVSGLMGIRSSFFSDFIRHCAENECTTLVFARNGVVMIRAPLLRSDWRGWYWETQNSNNKVFTALHDDLPGIFASRAAMTPLGRVSQWKFPLPWFAICTGSVMASILWWIKFRIIRKREVGLCKSCEYDLRGNTSGVCPECGEQSVGCVPGACSGAE